MTSIVHIQHTDSISCLYNDGVISNREMTPSKRPKSLTDAREHSENEDTKGDKGIMVADGDCHDDYNMGEDEELDPLDYRGAMFQDDGSMEYSSDNNFNVYDNHYEDIVQYDHPGYFDRTDIDKVQPPPSLFEDQYDADDEFHLEVDKIPIRQISIHENDGNFDDASLEYSMDDDSHENEMHHPLQTKKVPRYEENSPQDVIRRIETVIGHLVNYLSKLDGPILHEYKDPYSDETSSDDDVDSLSSDFFVELVKYNASPFKQFDNVARQRVFTSIVLIMSFIHSLLLSNRTTTTREVYYVFVTHFRSQKECDSAILDVAKCLGVPRRALGLSASPKGLLFLT